ncbi:Rieske (2Fe-2S) domain protein [Fibrella aestuarina BUZ 2]|uniref:Rieske (2Fe-2S) domain protein n=1 Tax=Fibrella aestuarina BUZ 2 TaxID=1166018 RepID=I0K3G8_9BACT|nr:Rieske (2Fe-2S) protein [Fibrella aestuarina]CCG98671.1 Rieske (2Fe-2S) domain protein [Fibrella aestuarina BUZ 2]
MNKNSQSVDTDPINESAAISRGDFMRSLGLSSAALMAFYCMGTTLSSCKSSDPAPTTPTIPSTGGSGSNGLTGNATTSAGAINFTLDLTNSNVVGLKTAGSALKVGDVFIANAKSGYVALQRLCTHEGQDLLAYRSGSDDIVCSAHGSEFKTDGSVNKGPAATALKRYTATLSADGNTLTVKA